MGGGSDPAAFFFRSPELDNLIVRIVPDIGAGPARASLARLKSTWREARLFRDFTALLACSVAYQAGISVVVALAAVYAEQALAFQQTETMMLIFLVIR